MVKGKQDETGARSLYDLPGDALSGQTRDGALDRALASRDITAVVKVLADRLAVCACADGSGCSREDHHDRMRPGRATEAPAHLFCPVCGEPSLRSHTVADSGPSVGLVRADAVCGNRHLWSVRWEPAA